MNLERIEKIGILEPMNFGDLLCSVPLFRSLRQAWPEAEIVLIGDRYVIPFFGRFRHYLDRLLLFECDIEWGEADELASFIQTVRAEHFDLLLKLYYWLGKKPGRCWWDEHLPLKEREKEAGSVESGAGRGISADKYWEGHQRSIQLACSLGARITAGIAEESALAPASFIRVSHRQDRYIVHTMLRLAEALGLPTCGDNLEFPITDQDVAAVRSLWTEHGLLGHAPIVGMHPGANVAYRRWPPGYFAQAADGIIERYGARIVFTGTSSEHLIIADILDQMRHPSQAHDLSGRTELGALAALFDQLNFLITNSTGSLHIAVARRCPSITIFGVQVEAIQWQGQDSRLHFSLLAPNGGAGMSFEEAMRAVTVDQVLDAAGQLMQARSGITRGRSW